MSRTVERIIDLLATAAQVAAAAAAAAEVLKTAVEVTKSATAKEV